MSIYGGEDPRYLAFYSVQDAALCLRLSPATLRAWFFGRSYRTREGDKASPPPIRPADFKRRLLSFVNLVEAQFLRGLRTREKFTLPQVRRALDELTRHAPQPHPLAFEDFLTDGAELFVEKFGKLISLDKAGQFAMKEALSTHLRRIERNATGPILFFPFVRAEDVSGSRTISIDPTVQFGRPVLHGTRVTTAELASRVRAGDTIEDVAEDLDLSPETVKEAILFEEAA